MLLDSILLVLLDSILLVVFADKHVKKIYILRWRNWRLKYVGVQDRALKLCPVHYYSRSRYWHVDSHCRNRKKCHHCSKEHEHEICSTPKRCFLFEGHHSLNSKESFQRKFEQDVVKRAHLKHINIGSARCRIMGAGKNVNASCASFIKGWNQIHVLRSPQIEVQPATSWL